MAQENGAASGEPEAPVRDVALAARIAKTITEDRLYHEKAFKRMRANMDLAKVGWTDADGWTDKRYSANIIGRHIRAKTGNLYAKNPKAVARRRETLDFQIWDEDPKALAMAMQAMQAAQAAVQQGLVPIDPMTGQPALPPETQHAQALLADVQAGMQRRQTIKRIGRTLEVLFAQAMREQKPVDFKTAMKKLVRRACTTGVAYVEIGFQREYGTDPSVLARMTDVQTRLAHLQRLADEAQEGEIEQDDSELAELEMSLTQLQQEPDIVVSEGLVYDFPASTHVIPDENCTDLVGFVGSSHLTVEYMYSAERVEELFGVDLKGAFTSYSRDGGSKFIATLVTETGGGARKGDGDKSGLVCVWKHYDKPSGLVYYLADGYDGFLRPPAAPDVFVEDFWPVYALTFNAVEHEDDLFPPSDVELLKHMQREYNRARDGKREHRAAARPRWASAAGALGDTDKGRLAGAEAFSVVELETMLPGDKIADKLQAIPMPGVDPNLYSTEEIFRDIQLVGGAQEANYGAVAKATATESAIAANSVAAADAAAVDDLDAFLTAVIRASGQVLLREMSEEKVMQVAGPGALWPHLTLEDVAGEVYLEIEAGSSGKPNQATEVHNWQQMLPFLVQMPGVDPIWLARETLRRLDDRLDLTEAIAEGVPSIVALNAGKGPSTGDPATDPAQQGPQGGQNKPAGPAEDRGGSGPAFGSNQV